MVSLTPEDDIAILEIDGEKSNLSPVEAEKLAGELRSKAEEIVQIDQDSHEPGWGIDKTVSNPNGQESCPSCEFKLDGEEKYCPECGEELKSDTTLVGVDETQVVTLTIGNKQEKLLPEDALDLSVDLSAVAETM